VQTVEDEFHCLPSFVSFNGLIVVEKYRQSVAGLARRMIADRQFDMRRLTRREIIPSTMRFIRASREQRSVVLQWALHCGSIDLSRIPSSSTAATRTSRADDSARIPGRPPPE
jgi:hypothetical protein